MNVIWHHCNVLGTIHLLISILFFRGKSTVEHNTSNWCSAKKISCSLNSCGKSLEQGRRTACLLEITIMPSCEAMVRFVHNACLTKTLMSKKVNSWKVYFAHFWLSNRIENVNVLNRPMYCICNIMLCGCIHQDTLSLATAIFVYDGPHLKLFMLQADIIIILHQFISFLSLLNLALPAQINEQKNSTFGGCRKNTHRVRAFPI